MDAKRAESLNLLSKMFSPELAAGLENAKSSNAFAPVMGEMAIENVFAALWTRTGLDLQSRSLVTLGLLIALRATEELQVHAVGAIRNGVTPREIEEVTYHASAYAGFPAAHAARVAVAGALERAGLLVDDQRRPKSG